MFCSAWPQPKPWPGEAGGWGDFAKCMLPCYVYSALRYFLSGRRLDLMIRLAAGVSRDRPSDSV